MGALPKRKLSTRRKGKRRINHRVSLSTLVKCPSCHADKPSHQACPACGAYN